MESTLCRETEFAQSFRLSILLLCHVERSETSQAVTFRSPKDEIQRFFASLRMTIPIIAEPFNRLTFQPIRPTSPSALGMGIGRNRNCPACKSLRRSEAALVGARPCAEILSDGGHFQKDALQRFQVADLLTARATSRILSKAVRSARRRL